MKINAGKTKLSSAVLKAWASDFWLKHPVSGHAEGDWKVITLFHGLPADLPAQKAEAHYATMAGNDALLDTIYASHTAHLPATAAESDVTAEDAYKLRNVMLRSAVQKGACVVTAVQDGDVGILKILQAAKSLGYRIELRSYLSHMGADAPSPDYDWKSHIGALRILPQLQDLSDEWTLNWKRLPYAMTETAMAPYLESVQDDGVQTLQDKLTALFPELPQENQDIYDTILFAHRGDALSNLQQLLALHVNGQMDKTAAPHVNDTAPKCVVPAPDLRSGDFARLLRRIDADVKRLHDDNARAFSSLHHAQRDSYFKGLVALHDMIETHVGTLAKQGLSLYERKEMGFNAKGFNARPL